jgi:hypothetical protein
MFTLIIRQKKLITTEKWTRIDIDSQKFLLGIQGGAIEARDAPEHA